MENQIAIIGIIATIVAPILALVVNNWIQNRNFPPVGKKRNISGSWKGTTTQFEDFIVNVSGTIRSKRKTITGDAVVEWDNSKIDLKIKGHFLDENHVHINYWSINKNIKNFGSQILKISANGLKLEGYTVGFGSESDTIITGKTELKKIP